MDILKIDLLKIDLFETDVLETDVLETDVLEMDAIDMDALTAAAASGILARIQSLDMLANNLANSSTSGFKSDRESYALYTAAEALESPEGTNPSILPVVQN